MIELDGRTLDYDEFRRRCLVPNLPAIIRHADAPPLKPIHSHNNNTNNGADHVRLNAEDTPAAFRWFHRDLLKEALSPAGLLAAFGPDFKVPVYGTPASSASASVFFSSSLCEENEDCEDPLHQEEPLKEDCVMETLGTVIERYWSRVKLRSTPQDPRTPPPLSQPSQRATPILAYLKDFHFQQSLEMVRRREKAAASSSASSNPIRRVAATREAGPALGLGCQGLYTVPDYLGDDWLNPFSLGVSPTTYYMQVAAPKTAATPKGNNTAVSPPHPTDDRASSSSSTSTSTSASSSTSTSTSTHTPRTPPQTAEGQGRPERDSGRGYDALPAQRFGDGWSDYRFAYIGPPGTQTLLHFDVFGSYSWSFNVCGDKRWYFPSPASNERLLERQRQLHGFPLPPDIRVLSDMDALIEVVQYPGDLVFVPAQYLHQVHNISGEVFRVPRVQMCDEEGNNNINNNYGQRPHGTATAAAGNDNEEDDMLAGQRDNDDSNTLMDDNDEDDDRTVTLTVSVNHNWCNAFNIERMVKEVFIEDAKYLATHCTEEELALLMEMENQVRQEEENNFNNNNNNNNNSNNSNVKIASPVGVSSFARDFDVALQRGCNWNFASMRHFLSWIMGALENTSITSTGIISTSTSITSTSPARTTSATRGTIPPAPLVPSLQTMLMRQWCHMFAAKQKQQE